MSTTQANEAAAAVLPPGAQRPVHVAPHLIRSLKVAQEDAMGAADGQAVSGVSLGYRVVEALRHFVQRSKPHWLKHWRHDPIKRAVDIFGALAITIVASPLILFILWAMWCEGGPILYRHRRIGRGGQPFDCLKFRTMVPNADQVLRDVLARDPELMREWVQYRKLRRDPRITFVGRYLRRSSLDELPQLWNVLRGEMSLVGPRPIVREELLRYGRKVREYQAVAPGITGLWQVMGRNDTNYRRRVALDTYYVRNRSLSLDIYILLKTTVVVIGGNGAY